MAQTVDYYMNNPLIHKDRRLSRSSSEWVRSFACEDLKPLIVCRGPIRKETMDVFAEMGMTHVEVERSTRPVVGSAGTVNQDRTRTYSDRNNFV